MAEEQNFYIVLEKLVDHLETKARLTQAEKLLRTAHTVLAHQKKVIVQKNIQLGEKDRAISEIAAIAKEDFDKLRRIPLWVRRIFNAD